MGLHDLNDRQLDLIKLCPREAKGPMCATLRRPHIGKVYTRGLIEESRGTSEDQVEQEGPLVLYSSGCMTPLDGFSYFIVIYFPSMLEIFY